MIEAASAWAIVALIVSSVIAVFLVYSEKKDPDVSKARKLVVTVLTLAALVAGIVQIRNADKEGADAEARHSVQHSLDMGVILGLNRTLTIMQSIDDKRDEQNQKKLSDLNKTIEELKLSKMSQADRETIEGLRGQIGKMMEPRPKAKLSFGFYEPNVEISSEFPTEKYIAAEGGVVKLDLTVAPSWKVLHPSQAR